MKKNINNIEIDNLKTIHSYLKSNLNEIDLQDLSNKCNSLNKSCKGDGAGLSSGYLIDILISEFFENKLKEYTEHRKGESDMKICNIELSQKKINGRSTIALDWSKNKNQVIKEYFAHHILIVNLKTERWWKKTPIKKIDNNINYNDIIKSGIYIINKDYCKSNIKLTSNNKSNTVIDSQNLYKMIKNSIDDNLYIDLPLPNKTKKFKILNAFLE
jgi:hypothetical protein